MICPRASIETSGGTFQKRDLHEIETCMKRFLIQTAASACLILAPAFTSDAFAQQRAQAPAAAPSGAAPGNAAPGSGGPGNAALGNLGTDSKEPIKIDADKLDVLDKESKAIFSGNVVAVQGKTTIRCAKMTILYDNRTQPGAPGDGAASRPATPRAGAAAGGDGGIKRLDCDGPVTVTSEDQVATSQRAVFDREKEQVVMTGTVALAKGPNVQRGERLVYNTKTGIANFDGGETGARVQGFFVPGSAEPAAAAPPARRPNPPARTAPPTN